MSDKPAIEPCAVCQKVDGLRLEVFSYKRDLGSELPQVDCFDARLRCTTPGCTNSAPNKSTARSEEIATVGAVEQWNEAQQFKRKHLDLNDALSKIPVVYLDEGEE